MGKIEKLTNSIKNQTGKEVKGMKKVLISLGLAMALVMAMVGPVSAATLTVTDTMGASGTGVVSQHDIAFTTGTEIPVGGTIEITFAKSGTFTGVGSIVDADVSITGLGSATSSESGSGQVVTCTIATDVVTASSSLTITIGDGGGALNDITNPSTAGTYAIYVVTKNASGAVLDTGYCLVNIGTGTAASVTVKTYISMTISDENSDGVAFGDVEPATEDNPDVAQSTADNTTPSVTISTGSENNVDVDIEGKINAVWSATWAAEEAEYALNAYDGTKVSYTTGYLDIDTSISAGTDTELWHFIDVPSGEPAGTQQNTLYYQATASS